MLQDIPFEIPPGQPPLVIVQAEAGDGKPLAMLFDTGAASPFDILLTPEALARLKGEAPPASAPVTPGVALAIRPERVERFRLGPVKIRNATAGISPAFGTVAKMLGRRVDGIVGYKFLKGRTISIDYRSRRLDLDARRPRGTPIPFTVGATHPLTMVQVMINGTGPYAFALDTGATASLVSTATARAAGLGEGEKVKVGGVGGAGSARLVRTTLALGGVSRANRNVAITDAAAAIGAAAGMRIDGLLGADFFAGTRVTFDYAANRMWIDAPASDAGAPAGVVR